MQIRSIGSQLVLLTVLLVPISASAQSVTLTAPNATQNLKTGDDFATDVLGQPWDGSNRRMIGWEENFVGNSISATGGVWRGTNQTPGGYVFPLFPGFANSLFPEPLPGDRTNPKLGARSANRLQTSKYSRLAYKLNHSSRSSLAVYWENVDNKPGGYWPDPNSPFGARYDGYFHNGVGYRNAGYTVYDFDMTNLAANFGQLQGTWSGNILALRLDPSTVGPAGAYTEIDWIRAVDPASAPNLTVTWNSSGLSAQWVVSIYEDNDNVGYNGTPIYRFTNGSNPGTYTFPSAILPPGTHYFYVEAQQAVGGSLIGSPVRSAYSALVNISQKPFVAINSPSPTSGDSYAIRETGNDWDMDASCSDVANLNTPLQVFRQFVTASCAANSDAQRAGRVFQAQAEPPSLYPGQAESDVQVHMRVNQSNAIDPSHYRYMTYRIAADQTNYPTIADKVSRGWVTRTVGWNSNILSDGFSTKAHVLYEGWKTYTYDLADQSNIEAGFAWNSFFRIPNFRVDPLETDVYTWFYIDWVQLGAENRTPNNQFTINYTVSDSDSSNLTVGIFYDTDNAGYNGTQIANLTNVAPGTYNQVWNTGALPNNTQYYIYITVSDGVNTYRTYSSVHVRTGTYVPGTPQGRDGYADFDFDGDGQSDQAVYRNYASTFFINNSTAGFQAIPWGASIFRPVHGDIDGDGATDRGLVTNYGGVYYWYMIRSGDGGLYARSWGLNGDHVVIGDYNGNGRDEIAVFRPSVGGWFILDENDQARIQYWGLPGDLPVTSDYDGDGKYDIAVWRPSTGTWFVINSTTGLATVQQWGLPGDVPIGNDWTGDLKADFMVWRPGSGTWFVRDSVSSVVTQQQWGLPGDVPRAGDFNGDGLLDFTIYRGGIWYHNYRNGQIGVVGFGLPGDYLPDRVGLTRLF